LLLDINEFDLISVESLKNVNASGPNRYYSVGYKSILYLVWLTQSFVKDFLYYPLWRRTRTRTPPSVVSATSLDEKKLRETQTLRAGCFFLRWGKFFSPNRRTLPGGAGRPKFNQLETVTTFTYKPRLVRIDACNFELSW